MPSRKQNDDSTRMVIKAPLKKSSGSDVGPTTVMLNQEPRPPASVWSRNLEVRTEISLFICICCICLSSSLDTVTPLAYKLQNKYANIRKKLVPLLNNVSV